MKEGKWLQHVIIRNLIGLAALLLIHYVSDRYYFHQRAGFSRTSPYLFVLLLYAWIVFHNRVLFEKLYLRDKKLQYFLWTLSLMAISSMNMHFTLVYGFDVSDTLPQVLSFWVYTLAGFGTFAMYKYLNLEKETLGYQGAGPHSPVAQPSHFECVVDGSPEQIPLQQILFLESLENYIKVIAMKKTFIVRLSLKEAEERLPKPAFIRISRSHIVNTAHSVPLDQENIRIRDQLLKIGKVYKRYVEEQLSKQKRTV